MDQREEKIGLCVRLVWGVRRSTILSTTVSSSPLKTLSRRIPDDRRETGRMEFWHTLCRGDSCPLYPE